MKSVTLVLLFSICIIFISTTHPTKSDYVIYGSLAFNYKNLPTSLDKRKTLNFAIFPTFRKFISKRFLLNSGTGYSFNSTTEKIDN